jgi:hypothetical protein
LNKVICILPHPMPRKETVQSAAAVCSMEFRKPD